MKIHGLQKMTLLDFPGRVACTVFLGGCDFRCPFCHNFELVDGSSQALMEEDELFAFLKKRTGLLDGVAITGGEPCLRPDLPELLAKIKDLGYVVKLDTNGTHPALLRTIIDEGLVDYVAMDVKNSPEKYAATVGLERVDLAPVRESVELLKSGRVDYEFRTTVVDELHDVSDFEAVYQNYKAIIFVSDLKTEYMSRALEICRKNHIKYISTTKQKKNFSSSELRAFCAAQGVHIWCKSDDIVYVNDNYLAIHSTDAGEKTIYLNGVKSCRELLAQNGIQITADTIKISMKENETKLFEITE